MRRTPPQGALQLGRQCGGHHSPAAHQQLHARWQSGVVVHTLIVSVGSNSEFVDEFSPGPRCQLVQCKIMTAKLQQQQLVPVHAHIKIQHETSRHTWLRSPSTVGVVSQPAVAAPSTTAVALWCGALCCAAVGRPATWMCKAGRWRADNGPQTPFAARWRVVPRCRTLRLPELCCRRQLAFKRRQQLGCWVGWQSARIGPCWP